MEDLNKKKTSATSIIAIVIVALLIGVGAYMLTKQKTETPAPEATAQLEETPVPPTETTSAPEEPAAPVVVETKKLDIPSAETPPPSALNTDPAIVALMAPRSIGDANAPVKITEYSSLTCSHCGAFHRETFKQFKADFVDTGKVQMTFKEFPLNQPAMDASQILRCMPEDKYVSFMDLLFQEQDKWAFDANYKDILRQNAKLAGMSDETFDTCLANTALKEAILGDMKAAGEQYKVQSTPSFVINGGKILVGNQPVEEFAKAINEASATTPPAAAAPSSMETAPEAAAGAAVDAATPSASEEEAPPAE